MEKFFDSVPWDLVIKAVRAHTGDPWVVLYVQRWLRAPLALPDRGTPQGSSISPVLANLFMHYAFDAWMARQFPAIPFERYADDVVVHCRSQRQAHYVRRAVKDRMAQVGLRLHPTKTKVVYCKDSNRRGQHEHTAFTFLGYTFRARAARNKRQAKTFTAFVPAISKDALSKISREVHRWRLQRKTGHTLASIARWINPIVRGWMQYYGAFHRSALYRLLARINTYLVRWLRNKYERLKPFKKAKAAWQRIIRQDPETFAHWAWATTF